MNKKDFELIASVLRMNRAYVGDDPMDRLAMDMAHTLAITNPRFDGARFVEATKARS